MATGTHIHISTALRFAAQHGERGLEDAVPKVELEVVGDGLAEGGAVDLSGKGAGVGAREVQREDALVDVERKPRRHGGEELDELRLVHLLKRVLLYGTRQPSLK